MASLQIEPNFDAPSGLTATITTSGGSWADHAAMDITAVDTALEKFTVVGSVAYLFPATQTFVVAGSTGNNGTWTVSSATEGGGNTVITVTGNITDATVDGNITVPERYSFLLVAWDDPREEDWNQARYRNIQPNGAANTFYSIYENLAVGTGDNDILNFTWNAPRKLPHHYTLYYQTATATWNWSTIGKKIRPSTGTTQALEIPGWATSAIFANSTEVQETRTVRVKSTSPNVYYRVEGNHAITLFNTAQYTPKPAGGGSTLDGVATVVFVGNEEQTQVNETATHTAQMHLEYYHGRINFQSVNANAAPITLSLITDFQPEPRPKNGIAFNGRSVPLAYSGGGDYLKAQIQFTHGGMTLTAGVPWADTDATKLRASALALLDKYRRLSIPVYISVLNDAGIYSGQAYYGTIEAINERGYTNIQGNSRIEMEVLVTQVQYGAEWAGATDVSEYAIVTASVNGAAVIAGDHTADFIAGTRYEIRHSTGNDGLYTVTSSAITGGTSTAIQGTPPLVDGTDDGYIRIWDQP